MSAQEYSVPGQIEGRRKAFLEWGKGQFFPINYISLTWGEGGRSNVNYYKSVQHLIPTRGNTKHPGDFQNKLVSFPFI